MKSSKLKLILDFDKKLSNQEVINYSLQKLKLWEVKK